MCVRVGPADSQGHKIPQAIEMEGCRAPKRKKKLEEVCVAGSYFGRGLRKAQMNVIPHSGADDNAATTKLTHATVGPFLHAPEQTV